MTDVHWKDIWKKRLWQMSHPNIFARPSRKLNSQRLLARLTFLAFVLLLALTLLGGAGLVILAKDLPRPDRVVRKEGFATKIYDRNGKLIYDVFENQKRTPIQLYQVPKTLKEATVAIEDKDFYKHKGFDPKGYLRSIYYVFIRHRLQGGSTLTQQLVKNVLLTSERTVKRKVKEFVLALEIESKYSKDQILQMYLNEAPYGGTIWGVEEAARTYFGKSVSDLNLTQSAILAGLPQSPSRYSPFGESSKEYIGRTKDVLRRMREDGYISQEEEKKSLEELENIQFATQTGTLKAPHFVMYIKKLLEDKYGEKAVELGGLRVTTSLDLDFQEKVQEIVSSEVAKVEKMHITNGAAIVMDPKTGEILAMVGSKNYDDPNYDGKFNVVLAKRQPGSAIKPVTYVTALKKGYTASTLLMDTITSFPGGANKPDYIPTNYDDKEHGPLQVRFALGNSINIAAVKMLAQVGIKEMLTTAYDMGLSTLEPTDENLTRLGLSVTLGGGEVRLIELASAYCAFANGGFKIDPVGVLKISDKDGNTLEEFHPVSGKNVLSPGEAFIISNILSDNSARLLTFSENNLLKFADREVAVKTGTTNDKRDNWTIGWTPQVMVGTWVGNNDNTSMKSLVSGVSGAAPIWRKILSEYLKGKPLESFSLPEDIVSTDVDVISGFRSHDSFPSRTEYFVQGTEPTESAGEDPVHRKIKVCKAQGKLATPVDISRGDFDEKEYLIFKENDPYAASGESHSTGSGQVNRWQKGIDDWVAKQGEERYHPPTDYCDTINQAQASILNPADHSQTGPTFTIKVEPISANEIVSVEIFVNGESKKVITSPPYELEVTMPDGKYTIKATVRDSKGNEGSTESNIGVNVPWDYNPTPTSTPTVTATPSITPTAIPL
ncbi:penicillin-binding protein [Candidatus Shapirobacteria bacterium CG07_land_8_20_14_0_80_39_18]|uniref:Penicillin-binding protein n=1 Tax=Candidatus Shapirobacteria bacterium CG07_land_8_20_14_0_80_39_18 TaxID=1974882 RepID=A0A2M6YQV4_9BACT|nr:MAG: penicillin-binding protein [Candidatus Shapirobacteria bacterium CG07_land_8_20_14_0_80_39_18]